MVSLPVVDAEEKLVGLITVDDVVDVLEEEATEDIFVTACTDMCGFLSFLGILALVWDVV